MSKSVPDKPKKPEMLDQSLMSCEARIDENGKKQTAFNIDASMIPEEVKNRKETLEYVNKKLFGTSNSAVAASIMTSGSNALPHSIPESDKYNLILNSCQEMAPRDVLEARLCAKETVLYNNAMHYLRRSEQALESNEFGSHLWHETHMNYALKLLRIHTETVLALDKIRRGGEQRVVVQHVNVEGGQNAFMTGNFLAGGGGKEKSED